MAVYIGALEPISNIVGKNIEYEGKRGKVIKRIDDKFIGIEFKDQIDGGHSMDGTAKEGKCLIIEEKDMIYINQEEATTKYAK